MISCVMGQVKSAGVSMVAAAGAAAAAPTAAGWDGYAGAWAGGAPSGAAPPACAGCATDTTVAVAATCVDGQRCREVGSAVATGVATGLEAS